MKNTSLVYEVKLPSTYNGDQRYPVIFALHGMGSDEHDMLQLMEPLKGDFILVGVRGAVVQGTGYAHFQIRSIGNPMREQFDTAVQGLQQLITDVSAEYAIDPARRYIAGFSQGAILAMTLSLVMGDAIKGIVAMSGYIPQFVKDDYALRPDPELSVFISHGSQDHLFPLQLGEDNAGFMRQHAKHITYVPYEGGHHVTPQLYEQFQKWLRTDAGLQNEDTKGMNTQ